MHPFIEEGLRLFADAMAAQMDREMLELARGVMPSPDAHVMSPGFFGHGDEIVIPDTPLDEWNAKVDELLKECEGYGGTTL